MVRLLGHRYTKGTETDKLNLRLPRHISTLQILRKLVIPARKRVDYKDAGGRATQEQLPNPVPRGKLKPIHDNWIPATSMDGGGAEEDMESSPPIHAGMTVLAEIA
jgi:hypothetical protein